MKKSDFYFDLPEDLIAQHPLEKRDSSKLLILDKNSGKIEHKNFTNIVDYIDEGDCLVMNDSRVIPARLMGQAEGKTAPIEVLLLNDHKNGVWECLTRPGKKTREGVKLSFGNGILKATVESVNEQNGNRMIKFEYDGVFLEILDKLGSMPLPPYIKEKLQDNERYQTVYSKILGSAAAPTAGLHFTKELLEKLEKKGVNLAYITLHVGLGTFRPVKTDDITKHIMHSESYVLDEKTADIINKTKKNGKKIWAVGTTATRTLETTAQNDKTVKAQSGLTDIFIYPPYKFKIVDHMITNFHLPESTLMMLICAFSTKENIMNAYKIAVENKYRFFSFGDSMMIY